MSGKEEVPPHEFSRITVPVVELPPPQFKPQTPPTTPRVEKKVTTTTTTTDDSGHATEIELRFVFDEKQTDIVTRVSDFRGSTVHHLAQSVRDTFNVPDQTIYFFQHDLRVKPQQPPLPRNTPISSLETSTGMVVSGKQNVHHYYVYWTHLAEDAGNWLLKRDRLLSIFGIALFQINADLRASTFQIFDTLKKIDLNIPAPVIENNFIVPMKETIEEEETQTEPQLKAYFGKLMQQWNSETIISELEGEYLTHPSNAHWINVEKFLREHHTKLLRSIETLRVTIRSLNENATFIDTTLRSHRFEAPIDAQYLPVGGHGLNVYPTRVAENGQIQMITNVTQSIDFALVSNLYDIQRQSFMFDTYRCDADTVWGLVNQIETRKRLWIVRDQLRTMIKLVRIWGEKSTTYNSDTHTGITWSGEQIFSQVHEIAAQGSAATCVPLYKNTLVFS